MRLTVRERTVLDAVKRRLTNKEIAQELGISARTAKFHVSSLLAKHGVESRVDLVLLQYQTPVEIFMDSRG